jgi:hypothetical protein
MRGLHPVTAQESGHGVDGGCRIDVFLAQVVKNLHVQRPVMPLVGFIQVDSDLHCHDVRHFTVPQLQHSRQSHARQSSA